MFAPAYMGRKRCFRMLLLRSRTVLSLEQLLLRPRQKPSKGLRPAVFIPRTLRRTWAPLRTFNDGVRIDCSWHNARCYRNLDRNLRLSQRSFSMKSRKNVDYPANLDSFDFVPHLRISGRRIGNPLPPTRVRPKRSVPGTPVVMHKISTSPVYC
jgi:hypothetical protein